MSIPLDRLYNHLDGLCNHDVLIYRFFPHGSKKLEDLSLLTPSSWFNTMTKPFAICNDQEPLNFDLYVQSAIEQSITNMQQFPDRLHNLAVQMNLRSMTHCPLNAYDKTLLVHSEKNSKQLDKYQQNGFIGVYWWSHALIAKDWFRYAEHDANLEYNFKDIKSDFLVYNRAWAGAREYRLKFSEILIEKNLVSACDTKFAPYDNDVHYTDHKFLNPRLQLNRNDIEYHIPHNSFTSCSSADYNNYDYKQCAIEVVLETLFDDSRLHLTEKSLRPIACGKPFILAATPGSLRYLRSYGFETFAPFIDETYDTIDDPVKRLQAITDEMLRITNLPQDEKQILWAELHTIAQRNKAKFFSDTWQEEILKEFKTNLYAGLEILQSCKTGKYWKEVNSNPSQRLIGVKYASGPEEIQQFLQWLTEVNS